MNYWKLKLMRKSICKNLLFIFLFLINTAVSAKDLVIEGNRYTDDDIVISIIDQIPDLDEKSQSNFI